MTPEEAARDLASSQRALLARYQVAALGGDDDMINRWLAAGRWVALTERVLRLAGAPPDRAQQVLASVLDGGPGTVASHASASAVWRLSGFTFGPLEVSRLRGTSGTRPALGMLHEPRLLPEWHVTVRDGIPVTSIARTVFDMAPRLHPDRLDQLVSSIAARSPGSLVAMHRMLPELAERGRPGIRAMRVVLEGNPVSIRPVGSNLERRVNRILTDAGEAPLRRQVDLGGHDWIGRVDLYDDPYRSVYEVDSLLHHTSPVDRRRDAERDAALLAAGFLAVVRIPEEHVWWQPSRVLAAVRDTRRRLAPVLAAETPRVPRGSRGQNEDRSA